MRLFSCTKCQNTVYFDNRHCFGCHASLAYDPLRDQMLALDEAGSVFLCPDAGEVRGFLCANSQYDACNWLSAEEGVFCLACRHNLVIPDVSQMAHLENWQKIEAAKHLLFYSLLRFGLPLTLRSDQAPDGLGFEFLADDVAGTHSEPILTGHDRGLITLNIAEGNDAEREARRVALGEPFRTLIGHFRHEIGHYYWNVLVENSNDLARCRDLFGDERADYGEALKRHYAEGPRVGWEEHFISSYAATHPYEDFAESFAHYFHIVDALETAYAFGLRTMPETQDKALALKVNFDPYHAETIEKLINAWVPLTVAINGINRSMGQPDLYPFVINDAVIAKLGFIHHIIAKAGLAASSAW